MMNLNAKQMKEVRANMTKLGISESEAVELWMFDNDFISNDVVDKIDLETKEAAPKKGSSIDKVKNLKAKKKADAEKEGVIKGLFEFLKTATFAVKPQEISTTKTVFQGTDGGWYTVTVTKNKSKPDGYALEGEEEISL